jgi:hypothetical protein
MALAYPPERFASPVSRRQIETLLPLAQDKYERMSIASDARFQRLSEWLMPKCIGEKLKKRFLQ